MRKVEVLLLKTAVLTLSGLWSPLIAEGSFANKPPNGGIVMRGSNVPPPIHPTIPVGNAVSSLPVDRGSEREEGSVVTVNETPVVNFEDAKNSLVEGYEVVPTKDTLNQTNGLLLTSICHENNPDCRNQLQSHNNQRIVVYDCLTYLPANLPSHCETVKDVSNSFVYTPSNEWLDIQEKRLAAKNPSSQKVGMVATPATRTLWSSNGPAIVATKSTKTIWDSKDSYIKTTESNNTIWSSNTASIVATESNNTVWSSAGTGMTTSKATGGSISGGQITSSRATGGGITSTESIQTSEPTSTIKLSRPDITPEKYGFENGRITYKRGSWKWKK